jgi:hypothetical protein
MESQKILKRFEQAKARKANWETLYQDAQQYACPNRDTFFDEDGDAPGQDKADGQIVFDSSAQDALMRFASNLQASLVPPMKRWSELKLGTMMQGNEQMDKALTNITDILFTSIQNSNFDTQIAEGFLDLGFGTGAILAFEGTRDNPFRFVNVPLSQLYLEEGPHGRVDVAFRKFKMAARTIEKQWEDAELTEELRDIVEESPDKQLCFVESTIPEKIEVFDRVLEKNVRRDGYVYCVIEEKTKTCIVRREMKTSPWIIFRWSNLPGEIYGRGPVLVALPDIKTLNETKKILLQSASISTLGMYTMADDGVINPENIELVGGAIIPVTSNPGAIQGPTLSPLNPAGKPDLSQLIIQDLQTSINKIMFGDPLGDVNLPVKTATEISMRQQELSKRIGSAYGKLQYELIHPLINRLLDILDSLGLIDLGEFTVDGINIGIKPVSPLAQAQDEEDIIRHIRYAETMIGLFGPEIGMGLVKPDILGRMLGDLMNISPGIIPTEEEVAQIKQALAQQAQAMQAQGQQ